MPEDVIEIHEIRKYGEKIDADYLRIEWHGLIREDPDVETERLVEIWLSPVEYVDRGNFQGYSKVEKASLESVVVRVGQLPVMIVGSVWKEGKLLPERFNYGQPWKLKINTSISDEDFKRAGDQDDGEYLIPFDKYFYPIKRGYSYCLKFTAEDIYNREIDVLIPSMELIRFYFCTSSKISTALFSGDLVLNLDSYINVEKSGYDGKDKLVISRRRDMDDQDMRVIGRTIADNQAALTLKSIYDSLIKNWYQYNRVNPKAGFPFEGDTNLNVRAVKLNNGGDDKARLLVLSIESCSAKLPFSEMIIYADNDGRQALKETDRPDSEKEEFPRIKKKHGENSDDLEFQSSDEANKDINPERKAIAGDRFTGFDQVDIKKLPKEECKYKSGDLKIRSEAIKALSLTTGEGLYNNSDVQPGVIQNDSTKKQENLPPTYEYFSKMVELLNEKEGFSAELRKSNAGLEKGLWEVPVDRPSKKRQWAFYQIGERRFRRHLMIAEVVFNSEYFLMIEIEQKPNEAYKVEVIKHLDRESVTDGALHKFIKRLSNRECRGRIINIGIMSSQLIRVGNGLEHRWKSPKEFCMKVHNLIAKSKKGKEGADA